MSFAHIMQQIAARAVEREAAVNFVIDGFGGGPRSSEGSDQENPHPITIHSVRNQRRRLRRVEIITKPGTATIAGNLNFEFRDESLKCPQSFSPTKTAVPDAQLQFQDFRTIIRNKLTRNLNRPGTLIMRTAIRFAILRAGEQLSQASLIPIKNRRLEGRSQLALTATTQCT